MMALLCLFLTDPVKPKIISVEEKVEKYEPISIVADVGSIIHSLDMNNMSLRCRATGLPKPKISWFKQGLPVQSNGEFLSILSAKKNDSGNYTCIATNLAGSVFKTSFVLIRGKP